MANKFSFGQTFGAETFSVYGPRVDHDGVGVSPCIAHGMSRYTASRVNHLLNEYGLNNLYDRLSLQFGVNRDKIKQIIHAANYSAEDATDA